MSQALSYFLRFLAFNSDDAPLIAPQFQCRGPNKVATPRSATKWRQFVTAWSHAPRCPTGYASDHNNDNNGSLDLIY